MATLAPQGRQQYTTATGVPLAGGLLYTYAAGTSTPLATYSNQAGTVPNANPVVLNSRGEATIFWGDGPYKVVLHDAADVPIWTQDDMYPPAAAADLTATGGTLTSRLNGGVGTTVGSALVTATGSASARSLAARFADTVAVKDFGALGDGTTDDTAAINAAIALGGTVRLTGPATYRVSSGRLLMTVASTTLKIDANVTILFSGWTYPGSQTPFGNAIHVTANDCAVIGSGSSSLIQITGGSQANGIGLLHAARLRIENLAIDGDKTNETPISDDTFQTGISIIADTGSGATNDTAVVIDRVEVRNFAHYGIQFYGNRARGNAVANCNVHDNGKAGASGVAGGFAITRGVANTTIANCQIHDNYHMGIFGSSAGAASSGITLSGNTITGNGTNGVHWTEESQWGSVAGVGTDGLTISGGTISGNGDYGVRLGTFDNVGYLRNVSVGGGVLVTGNTNCGVGVQTNDHASNRTSRVSVSGAVISGNGTGVTFGSNLDGTVVAAGNLGTGNSTDVSNSSAAAAAAFGSTFAAGSWTPEIVGDGTAGSTTYSSQAGTYTRIGNRVFIDAVITWTAMTGTGNLRLTGLPFSADGSEPQAVFWTWANGLTVTGQLAVLVTAGQTSALVFVSNNGSGVSQQPVSGTGSLRLSGSYRTAS